MRKAWITLAVCLFITRSGLAAPALTDPNLVVTEVASGLSLPTTMVFIGPDDILVLQKNDGLVRRVIAGVVQPNSVLDVNVDNLSERGLLGIALHPDFPTTPHVYLYFTESSTSGDSSGSPAANRVYRYIWNGTNLVSPTLILNLPVSPGPNHDGGFILFGPDGKLYVVIGDLNRDGKLQNFPGGAAPDDTSVILRLNPDGSTPSDNPFFSQGGNVARYFAYGIRNSFGMTFDPLTGILWITENGPDSYDEINRVDPGFNSGWETILGPDSRDPSNVTDLFQLPGSHYSDPKFSWLNTVGPTGIAFLGSQKLGAQYQFDAFVGDINNGNLYHFKPNSTRDGFVFSSGGLADLVADNPAELNELIFGTGFNGITDVKEGPDGRLYVVSLGDGKIYAISSGTVPPDTTPPDTNITSGPMGILSVNNATLSWTGSDNSTPTANLLYASRLDPIEPSFSVFGSSTTKSYSNLVNGNYTFLVKAMDQSGNQDPTPANRSFTVNVLPPPIISLTFNGQIRDRVGQNNQSQGMDGHLDPTFTVNFSNDGNTRTVTSLRLDSSGGGTWDTNAGTVFWTLGAASDVDAVLYNNGANDGVNFAVGPGGSFNIFVSDWFFGGPFPNGLFQSGSEFVLTIGFSHGSSATANATIPAVLLPTVTIAATTGTVTEAGVAGGFTVMRTGSTSSSLTVNYTVGGTATNGADYQLLSGNVVITANSVSAAIPVTPLDDNVVEGDETVIVALSSNANYTVGSSNSAIVTIADNDSLPPPDLQISLVYNDTLRDRVGQNNQSQAADGQLDPTFTVSFSNDGNTRTVTSLRLDSSSGGTWDADAGTGFWTLGAASDVDAVLYNNGANDGVNFAVGPGGSFNLFASDWFMGGPFPNGLFQPGTGFILTIGFSDGSTATASTTLQAITLTYNGQLRDRVGQNNQSQGMDGHLDPTFTVSFSNDGNTRTVTSLRLDSSAGGAWDTDAGTVFWTLGAASDVDAVLYNNGANDGVNFAVGPGGSFNLFASDWFMGGPFPNGLFQPGSEFILTIGFSDGSTATANSVLP